MTWNVAKVVGKVALFVIATLAVVSAFVLPLMLFNPFLSGLDAEEAMKFDSLVMLAFSLLSLVASVVAAGALLWLFDRRGLGSIGLRGERAVSDTIIGLAFGAATLLISLLAVWVVDVARPNMTVPPYTAMSLSIGMASVLAAAAAEEVMFRGYLFHELLSKFTARTAIFVSSILFALVHVDMLLEDAMGAVGFVNLVLAGVLMALAVLKTGTL